MSLASFKARRKQIHRRRSDEFGDEGIGRLIIELERRSDLLDPAGAQDDDAVGHGQRFDLIMGHIDRGRMKPVVERLDLAPHRDPELGVEV